MLSYTDSNNIVDLDLLAMGSTYFVAIMHSHEPNSVVDQDSCDVQSPVHKTLGRAGCTSW
jgi:hypothetical protein